MGAADIAMLTHLQIRNFALVDRLDLEIGSGFTVLTGETGAGKSILIEALGLALGDRADSTVIREGEERAEVSANFELATDGITRAWLAEHDLDDDGQCLLRRTLSREGRSKAFINGRPVPLQLLRDIGEQLVDIHGQHEHQSLLKRDCQLQLLDEFGGHGDLLAAVAQAYRHWQKICAELDAVRAQLPGTDGEIDLLHDQIRELEDVNPRADDLVALEDEHRRLSHFDELFTTCQHAVASLYDDEASLYGNMASIGRDLRDQLATDRGLTPAVELLDGAVIQLQEAIDELRTYLDRLHVDPERLSQIETRLTALHDLARKHRVRSADLPAVLERLHARLNTITGAGERVTRLQSKIAKATATYHRKATALTQARRQVAEDLSTAVTAGMQELGMRGGRLSVRIDRQAEGHLSPYGAERVEFMVSTNPGQNEKPLARIVSGGELSRVSLAIQVHAAGRHAIPTLIFDEVDSGVGGRVAEIVGQLLKKLGQTCQVLCVTHLPQVAALAHQHLQVAKSTSTQGTITRIGALSDKQRGEEIARMLGGIEISKQTRAHAKEMLQRSQECT